MCPFCVSCILEGMVSSVAHCTICPSVQYTLSFFLKFERERACTPALVCIHEGGAEREREREKEGENPKQALCHQHEPLVGLDPTVCEIMTSADLS